MHGKHANLVPFILFSLELCCHVSQHLVQSSFAGGISAKAILEVPEERCRPRVGGDEDDSGRRVFRVDVDQLLCTYDRTDRVSV